MAESESPSPPRGLRSTPLRHRAAFARDEGSAGAKEAEGGRGAEGKGSTELPWPCSERATSPTEIIACRSRNIVRVSALSARCLACDVKNCVVNFCAARFAVIRRCMESRRATRLSTVPISYIRHSGAGREQPSSGTAIGCDFHETRAVYLTRKSRTRAAAYDRRGIPRPRVRPHRSSTSHSSLRRCER